MMRPMKKRDISAPVPYGLRIIDNCLSCHLREDRLFCNLPPDALRAFNSLKQLTVYPKGAMLFLEGQAARGVFLICEGQVKLSMGSRSGRTLILKMAEAGEIVGLPATMSDQPYELTAETYTPCQINFVRREDFLAFLRNHTDAAMQVARELSERYRSACREIRMLGLAESAAEKLSLFLLDACARHGEPSPEGTRLRVTLTQEEIAQQIGATRETVSRLLSEMRGRNVISQRGSMLVVHDAAALEEMSVR
jgi:CRP/FNR family transcriptional regulator